MKIQIITICDPVPNFGNKLQNYAVQTYLKRLTGAQISTLEFEGNRCTWKSMLKYFLWKYLHLFNNHKQYLKEEFPKALAFRRFDRKYLKTTKKFNPGNIDYFVVGSDQVWNPNWYHTNVKKKTMFLLSFAKPEQRVCFSPSFGLSELPEKWKAWFKEQLELFPALNVREQAGAKIIKELTGRDAEVLIDPTLMLSKEEWRAIEKKPKGNNNFEQPYILTYFLGETPVQAEKDIIRISKEKGMKIYQIMSKEDLDIYCSSPSEFVYLFDNARLILTDSFHACVFSFIFEKPFLVYKREGKESKLFSRIQTLLDLLDLKCKFVDGENEKDIDNIFWVDYTNGKNKLVIEQLKVKRCLEMAFNIEEGK